MLDESFWLYALTRISSYWYWRVYSSEKEHCLTRPISPLQRPQSIRVIDLVLSKRRVYRSKSDKERVCQITRQHKVHTPTRVLIAIHRSNDQSLSEYSTWYTYRRAYARESDILERLTAIEPQQEI
jgi:hypothetical protein